MRDPLHSNNLVPFKRHRDGYHLPGGADEAEEKAMEQLDPNLSVEEQSYVRHYLAYADTFLKNAKEEPPPGEGTTTGSSVKQEEPGKKAA